MRNPFRTADATCVCFCYDTKNRAGGWKKGGGREGECEERRGRNWLRNVHGCKMHLFGVLKQKMEGKQGGGIGTRGWGGGREWGREEEQGTQGRKIC